MRKLDIIGSGFLILIAFSFLSCTGMKVENPFISYAAIENQPTIIKIPSEGISKVVFIWWRAFKIFFFQFKI